MRRIPAVLVAVAACPMMLSAALPAYADDEGILPTTVSIGVPEVADLAAGGKATCSTTAVPPQELGVDDPRYVRARTELACSADGYPATLSAQFKYYGDDPAGPMGSGTLVDAPVTVAGQAPLTAIASLSRLSGRSGWYKTVGDSTVTYPYKLNRSASPGQGCTYTSDYTVVCSVASSAVFVDTLAWVQQAIQKILP